MRIKMLLLILSDNNYDAVITETWTTAKKTHDLPKPREEIARGLTVEAGVFSNGANFQIEGRGDLWNLYQQQMLQWKQYENGCIH